LGLYGLDVSLEELAVGKLTTDEELDDDEDEFSPKFPFIWLSITIEGEDNRFICEMK
jgi:hypothetical protein